MTTNLDGPILFIENREKTSFWAAVARNLMGRGLKIEWLVQNPHFQPRDAGPVHLVPFPPKANLAGGDVPIANYPALTTDRGRQYFGAGSAHYPYYSERIRAAIDRISPLLIVGETTLFHELIASAYAEAAGIIYLHPAGGRYPTNRFFLFQGTSQIPFIGSGEAGDPVWKQTLANGIAHGNTRPTYMIKSSLWTEYRRRIAWMITRWRVLLGRIRGEHYNTPSIGTKIALILRTRRNTQWWDRIASMPPSGCRAILYPLQLQPESNMDVWGRPYSDQPTLIRALLAAAPNDLLILVKANPRLRYEMSDELLTLAKDEPRVVLLPRDLPIADAQKLAIGAVTASGTVGLEAIFGRGRCVSLGHPVIKEHFPRAAARDPEDAVRKLLDDPSAGLGNCEDGVKLLTELSRLSFPGLIGDPLWLPKCLDAANVVLVADSVEAGWRKALAQRTARRTAA